MNLQRNRSEADNNWFEFNTGRYTPTSSLFIYLSKNNQDQRIKNILDASSTWWAKLFLNYFSVVAIFHVYNYAVKVDWEARNNFLKLYKIFSSQANYQLQIVVG